MKRFLFAAAAVVGLIAVAATSAPSADAAGLRLMNFNPGSFDNVIHNGSAQYYLTYSLENAREEAARPKLRIELRTETDKTYGDSFSAAVAERASGGPGGVSTSRFCPRSCAAAGATSASVSTARGNGDRSMTASCEDADTPT